MLDMRRNLWAVVIIALISAGAAQGEVSCKDDEKLLECWARYRESRKPEAKAAEKKAEVDSAVAVENEPTGSDTQSANLASNTKNFLPLLAMSGLLGDAREGETEGTLAFDLNFLVPGLGDGKNAQLQAIVNTEATLSEVLKTDLEMKLPEDTRDDSIKKLGGDIGDLGEYSLAFSYKLGGRNAGRDFKTYRRRFEALVTSARGGVQDPNGAAIDKLGEIFEEEEFEPSGGDPLPLTFKDIAQEVGDGKMRRIKEAFEKWIDAEATGVAAVEKALKDNYLDRFGALLDNQPQFHFSARKTFRDALVGGDEEAIKLTYEWGATNFKKAMSESCHEGLDKDLAAVKPDDMTSCLTEYVGYVKDNNEDIDKGTRLSIAAEYMDISEATVDFSMTSLSDAGLAPIVLPAAEKLIISGGYSRDFRGDGGVPVRLDLVAKYEDVSDDPMRQDRGVVTLTVTRKFGNMTIPFGIVYANHSEFLTDVDEQLTAHIGLKFNLSSLTGLGGSAP